MKNYNINIIGNIKRNSKFLDKDRFLIFYKSLVRSHLEYANCMWYPHSVSDIKILKK